MAETEERSASRVMTAPKCVSIDLEIGKTDQLIQKIGAVRGEDRSTFCANVQDLQAALRQLDAFTDGADFLLGHNIIEFDIPHLHSANPGLRLLNLPVIDTLRLNPLAFPRNPYHHLVKHYQDGQLRRRQINDPVLDAGLTLEVFLDQCAALANADPALLSAWHWLTTIPPNSSAQDTLFTTIRQRPRPTRLEAMIAIRRVLTGHACTHHTHAVLGHCNEQPWPLAFALAWISVAGEKSVMPPWVRHQFPQAREIVQRLRDTPCNSPSCPWCSEHHDARKALQRFFGFDEFRPEPAMEDGSPMQQAIVKAAMHGEQVLGILPTGAGKSVCYQVPALSRYFNTGALSVVISPLVALMEDQVDGLRKRGFESIAALNGLLSMPERADVLDGIRLGDIGILIVSPEQLRSRALRRVLDQREIGAWVMDEAHCLSKWGHDFRPDYRYVGRYIRERADDGPLPPLLCLTATAKPEVIAEICDYFNRKLGISLRVFNGGSNRSNLEFEVIPTTPATKFGDVHQLLAAYLPEDRPGGAIVYCASRKRTEELAEYLQTKQIATGFFHAKLKPEAKRTVQQNFLSGGLRVITATNAFGMGIDKPDVRVVIHADIPGSLENYIQEAGRAGRDRESARCVLLYTTDDIERQFGMSAHSRLRPREIQAILKSLKRLDRKKHADSTIVATTGEILTEDEEAEFDRDSATDDTRVRTAICWLEESQLLTREENVVQIFPSSLLVTTVEDAEKKFVHLARRYANQLSTIVAALLAADCDEGVSTNELTGVSGLSSEELRKAFYDLEHLGVARNDTVITAYIHHGVVRASQRRLEHATNTETQIIELLRINAPDMAVGEKSILHLRHTTQALRDAGIEHSSPAAIANALKALSRDGRGDDSGLGSIRTRKLDSDHIEIVLQRPWSATAKTAELRRAAAEKLLTHLIERVPSGARGNDLLVETTMGNLTGAIEQDIMLRSEVKNVQKLLDRALLWLHEQRILRLNKGLTVFRPAMTIRLDSGRRSFTHADFEPLKLHYNEQVLQIHVMAEYAKSGLRAMTDAIHLAVDYFRLRQEEFLARWLPGMKREVERQTTPESWQTIVESLANPVQQRIVQDDREQTNVLVLAGPGSGKTRVLVHRIAYLIRARRERSTGILALAYNRHAAVEIRRRLHALIGNDALGVTILTCHAMAMRLIGASFAGRKGQLDDGCFRDVLQRATALLNGNGLLPDEADEQRERLLAGFRWILVDEYQDITCEQYELISALAGRTLNEEDGRLTLFAVGDDDQNIYAFNGASIEFIQRFEQDYKAKPSYMVENYRSTRNIIDASNLLIASAGNRLKTKHPITIDRNRSKEAAGGALEQIDPVGCGRVQILQCAASACKQALAAMTELERLAALQTDWDWASAAVIAREWRFLEPVRAYCELQHIPVQMADEEAMVFWRLRETQALIDWVRASYDIPITATEITTWLSAQHDSPWNTLLHEAVETYVLETGKGETPRSGFIEWLAEWGREIRRRQNGLLLLSAHRAKGLEFDHVVVLDGSWDKTGANEDRHAARRLYYVAMTRAKKSLCLLQMDRGSVLPCELPNHPSLIRRSAASPATLPAGMHRRYQRTTLGDVDLSFAGRLPETSPVQQAIRCARPGDPLQLITRNQHFELLDRNGIIVGRMSRSFRPIGRLENASARVAAVIVWLKDDSALEFQPRIKCAQWETIIPAFEYEPSRSLEMNERGSSAKLMNLR